MKYKTGLLIGRFQPFHKGHLYLLHKARKMFHTLIIGVGSVNKRDLANPFSYTMRKEMIQLVLQKEHLTKFVEKIISLEDDPDDLIWLKNTLVKTGNIDVVLGNNEWVNGIFENAGYSVIRLPFYKRDLYEGIQIRELMNKGEKWDDRVPEYLKEIILENRHSGSPPKAGRFASG